MQNNMNKYSNTYQYNFQDWLPTFKEKCHFNGQIFSLCSWL